MRTYWRCRADWLIPPQECDAAGEYIHTGGSASGPAHSHTTKTGHPTETSARLFTDAMDGGALVEVWQKGITP